MNIGKIVEWGAIALAVLFCVRLLSGLFSSNVFQGTTPQMQGPGVPVSIGYPYGTGAVYMMPGIVGQWPAGQPGSGRQRGVSGRNR